eukprot:s828_g22.t1
MNSGTSEDHRLLIRTAIQGDMTWDRVCEELVAQHSRIHEKESKGYQKGYSKSTVFKGHGKSYNSYGKGKGSWKSYHAAEEYDDQWENASQSLGGFEDFSEDATAYNMRMRRTLQWRPIRLWWMKDWMNKILRRWSTRRTFFKLKLKSIMHDFELPKLATTDFGEEAEDSGFESQEHLSPLRPDRPLEWRPWMPKRSKGEIQGNIIDGEYGNFERQAKGVQIGQTPYGRTVYFAINEYSNNDSSYDVQSYMVLRDPSGRTADEMLDAMIAQAQANQSRRATTMLTAGPMPAPGQSATSWTRATF